ncbi:hypothetical protein QAD02_016889 [Eretmocerus hayati]|uniref:Uncharacterized protein n=1 Tax=Eretmocerus hayati TaxID=131215 RepID=A0ACC2PF81_9HYME|nr:hypothetical protein QAD02_016889 [Eretmocerus hayati]
MNIINASFACFGAFCNQGAELSMILRYRAVLFCSYILSWVLIICFSSQIYIVMTRSILVPPFWSLETLFKGTDYQVLVENSTAAFRAFQGRHDPILGKIIDAHRVEFYKGFRNLWEKACSHDKRSAAYHFTYQYPKIIDNNIDCELEPTGESERTTCIAALIPKNFIFKKFIDYGIIKLHEFGIISAAKNRWIREKPGAEIRPYSPITLEQVYFPLSVYLLGLCLSVILSIIEKITFDKPKPVHRPPRKRIS